MQTIGQIFGDRISVGWRRNWVAFSGQNQNRSIGFRGFAVIIRKRRPRPERTLLVVGAADSHPEKCWPQGALLRQV